MPSGTLLLHTVLHHSNRITRYISMTFAYHFDRDRANQQSTQPQALSSDEATKNVLITCADYLVYAVPPLRPWQEVAAWWMSVQRISPVEDGDGLKNRVSILILRPDISVKTPTGSAPVKHKKRGFDKLSARKSALPSGHMSHRLRFGQRHKSLFYRKAIGYRARRESQNPSRSKSQESTSQTPHKRNASIITLQKCP